MLAICDVLLLVCSLCFYQTLLYNGEGKRMGCCECCQMVPLLQLRITAAAHSPSTCLSFSTRCCFTMRKERRWGTVKVVEFITTSKAALTAATQDCSEFYASKNHTRKRFFIQLFSLISVLSMTKVQLKIISYSLLPYCHASLSYKGGLVSARWQCSEHELKKQF